MQKYPGGYLLRCLICVFSFFFFCFRYVVCFFFRICFCSRICFRFVVCSRSSFCYLSSYRCLSRFVFPPSYLLSFLLLLYLSRFALSTFCGRVGDMPLLAATFAAAPSVPAPLGTGLFISGFLSDLRFRFPMKLSRYTAVFHARFHFIFSVLFAPFYATCFLDHICCR